MIKLKSILSSILKENEYTGSHMAPDKESGSPLFDVTLNANYPSDFYSHNGLRYYGTGDKLDDQAYYIIRSYYGLQNKNITIYRAIPKDIHGQPLNKGDWVTIVRQYAVDHGKAELNGKYKIVKKIVKARDIFTDGDSILEWGYDPQPEDKKYRREILLRKRQKNIDNIKNGVKRKYFNLLPTDPYYQKENEYLQWVKDNPL